MFIFQLFIFIKNSSYFDEYVKRNGLHMLQFFLAKHLFKEMKSKFKVSVLFNFFFKYKSVK